jgi:hypothetical protein
MGISNEQRDLLLSFGGSVLHAVACGLDYGLPHWKESRHGYAGGGAVGETTTRAIRAGHFAGTADGRVVWDVEMTWPEVRAALAALPTSAAAEARAVLDGSCRDWSAGLRSILDTLVVEQLDLFAGVA